MKKKIGLMVVLTVVQCHALFAVQRVVIDASKAPKTQIMKWTNDGDIHLIDFDMKGQALPSDGKLLKVAMPHHGIWIKNLKDNLPENIAVRYAHITSSLGWVGLKPTLKGDEQAAVLEKADAACGVGNYKDALASYLQFYHTLPMHPASPYALFQAGQCLLIQGKPRQSVALHKALWKKYPRSKYAEAAIFRIACVTAGHLDLREDGEALFLQFIKNSPQSRFAEDALFMVAALKVINRDLKQGAVYFQLYLKTYPDGMHAAAVKKNLISLMELSQ